MTSNAQAGDPTARGILVEVGHRLGEGIAGLVNVLDPETIVVGGGLGTAGGVFWERFVASTREHIWSETQRDLPIAIAEYANNAGFVGAAALALRKFQPGVTGER